MSKSKKASTQTNKQFRKTDMSTGAKCKTETSKKIATHSFCKKTGKKDRNSTGQKLKTEG